MRALTRKLSLRLELRTWDYGRAFEHFFLLQAMRQNHYLQKDLEFTFYRTEAGAEVDVIIEKPNRQVIAIELKELIELIAVIYGD